MELSRLPTSMRPEPAVLARPQPRILTVNNEDGTVSGYQTVPLLGEVTTSVTHVNQELVRVDAITANVQSISGNVSALTSLFAATLGSPIIKVAAFSYGVRKAAGKRDSDEMTKRVKAELKGSKRL